MKVFTSKRKLVNEFAKELAYLQIRADWWHYASRAEDKYSQNMSSKMLDDVAELRCICSNLGIMKAVYEKAYKIYDFRNSGKKGFMPDVNLIKKLNKEFCEPMKKKRPI